MLENERKRHRAAKRAKDGDNGRGMAADEEDDEDEEAREPIVKKKQRIEAIQANSQPKAISSVPGDGGRGQGKKGQEQDFFKSFKNSIKKGNKQTKSLKSNMKLVKYDF